MSNEQDIERAVLESTIGLTLTVDEVNKLLSIVSKFPFEEVSRLIARIHEEGQPQINATVAKLKAQAETETPKSPELVEAEPIN